MTGKDIIIYILQNDLVDKEIITKECISDILSTPEELAEKYNCGVATIMAMYNMGMVKGYEIGGQVYFSKELKPRRELDSSEK